LEPLLQHPLNIEEKIDGSQFSAARIDGVLKCRSKGQELVIDAPEKMFAPGVAAVAELDLHDGWTYRGEYLKSPKHNTLAYSRIPTNHVIIFDINTDDETYLSYDEKAAEAARIGLEIVPLVGVTNHLDLDYFQELLTKESILGGTTIEGVVLKPVGYDVFGLDKKCVMGKYVSEAFKEKHKVAWKEGNPGGNDILQNLIAQLKTEARWKKAVQHLRDAGELENDPRDIGKLMKALNTDVLKEEEIWIKEELFKWAWSKINRGLNAGFASWYKEELAKAQLSGDNETV
jgi:hypothetical protein